MTDGPKPEKEKNLPGGPRPVSEKAVTDDTKLENKKVLMDEPKLEHERVLTNELGSEGVATDSSNPEKEKTMTGELKSESKKSPEDQATRGVPNSAAFQSGEERRLIALPVVMKLEKRKSRDDDDDDDDDWDDDEEYSEGTKGAQRLTLGVSKAAYRTANSFARGFSTFADRSEESSRKRRDGLVKDILRNSSKAFEEGMNEFGKAPDEIAKKISSRTVTRMFRLFIP